MALTQQFDSNAGRVLVFAITNAQDCSLDLSVTQSVRISSRSVATIFYCC